MKKTRLKRFDDWMKLRIPGVARSDAWMRAHLPGYARLDDWVMSLF